MSDDTQTHADLWLDACHAANNFARMAQNESLSEPRRLGHAVRASEWAAVAQALRPANAA